MMQQRSIFRISLGSLLAFSLFGALTVHAQLSESSHDLSNKIKIMKAEIADDQKIMATTNPKNTSYRQAELRLRMNEVNLRGAQAAFDAARNAEQIQLGRNNSQPARVGGGGGAGVASQYDNWAEDSLRNVPEWDKKGLKRVEAEQARAASDRARRDAYESRNDSFVANTRSNAVGASAGPSEAKGNLGALPPEEVSTLFKRLKSQASNLDGTLLDNIFPGNFKVSEELTLRTESAKRQYLMQQLEKLMTDMTASESEAQKLESLKKFIAKHGWFGRYVQSFAARGEMFDANMAKQTIASGEGLEKVKKMAGSKYELVAALRRHVSGVTPYLSSKAKEGVVGLLFGAVLTAAAQAGEAESIADGAAATSSSAANDRAAFRPEARARRVSK